jgi:hypothetical protein
MNAVDGVVDIVRGWIEKAYRRSALLEGEVLSADAP